jgi:hypothetical protein
MRTTKWPYHWMKGIVLGRPPLPHACQNLKGPVIVQTATTKTKRIDENGEKYISGK